MSLTVKNAISALFAHDLHSPLHLLAKTVCKDEATRAIYTRVLKTFLSKNPDLRAKNYKGNKSMLFYIYTCVVGETCLHLACSSSSNDAVRVILEYPHKSAFDVNLTTKVGETCLHYAVRSDNILAASLLLQHFADYGTVSEEGTTFWKFHQLFQAIHQKHWHMS
jgi:ankyrin repeat protein